MVGSGKMPQFFVLSFLLLKTEHQPQGFELLHPGCNKSLAGISPRANMTAPDILDITRQREREPPSPGPHYHPARYRAYPMVTNASLTIPPPRVF